MDDREIVSAVHAKLADRVGTDRYETWFANGSRLTYSKGRMTVYAPSKYLQELQRKLFRRDLVDLCAEIIGLPVEVHFCVEEKPASEDSKQTEPSAETDQPAAEEPPATILLSSVPVSEEELEQTLPPAAQEKRKTGRPTSERKQKLTGAAKRGHQFEQYVEGPCNRMALHSTRLILEQPGKMTPLTLYGRAGLGKTHLLESLHSVARDKRSNALYLTAEQFTSYYIEACQGKGVPNFRQKYRGVDLLLIDDIHFFSRTRGTLVELLYTIDTLQRAGKQLVFAADRGPAELTSLGPEIVGRLNSGLHCEIIMPDYATRRGIVNQLCERLDFSLPAGVDSLIAMHITGTARDIKGALNLLDATSRTTGEPLSLDSAEETILKLASQTNKVVNLKDIQEVVCDVFGVTKESLNSNRRGEDVQHPRMLAMFLARKHTRAALGEISRYFGRRSHSTVITANKTVGNWMEERRTLTLARQQCDVEQAIRRIEEQLKAM